MVSLTSDLEANIECDEASDSALDRAAATSSMLPPPNQPTYLMPGYLYVLRSSECRVASSGRRSGTILIVLQYRSLHVNGAMLVEKLISASLHQMTSRAHRQDRDVTRLRSQSAVKHRQRHCMKLRINMAVHHLTALGRAAPHL
jgi:hypothetical protein